MDKMLFAQGGQPLYLDDLAYLQETTRDALALFFGAIGDCIVKGTITGSESTMVWSDCTALIGGEIVTLEAGQMDFETAPDKVYIKIVATPQEQRTFGDGSLHPVREHRRAVVTTIAEPGSAYMTIYKGDKGMLTKHLSLQEWLKAQIVQKQDFRAQSNVGKNPRVVRTRIAGEVAVIQGSVYIPREVTLVDGVIMSLNGAYGGAYGKALVHTDKLPGGTHVYLGGNYVAIKDAAGNNLRSIPADTMITFSVCAYGND